MFLISDLFMIIFPILNKENKIFARIALIAFGVFLIAVYINTGSQSNNFLNNIMFSHIKNADRERSMD